jgi:hypothetical protein
MTTVEEANQKVRQASAALETARHAHTEAQGRLARASEATVEAHAALTRATSELASDPTHASAIKARRSAAASVEDALAVEAAIGQAVADAAIAIAVTEAEARVAVEQERAAVLDARTEEAAKNLREAMSLESRAATLRIEVDRFVREVSPDAWHQTLPGSPADLLRSKIARMAGARADSHSPFPSLRSGEWVVPQ